MLWKKSITTFKTTTPLLRQYLTFIRNRSERTNEENVRWKQGNAILCLICCYCQI